MMSAEETADLSPFGRAAMGEARRKSQSSPSHDLEPAALEAAFDATAPQPEAAPAPPPRAPARPASVQWVPDSAAAYCMECKRTKFSVTKRRHHCRHCGHVIGTCCSHKALLPNEFMLREPQRVCTSCLSLLAEFQEDLIKLIANQNCENTEFHHRSTSRHFNNPIDTKPGHAVRKAAHTVGNFFPLAGDGFKQNPNAVIRDAKLAERLLGNACGLAFLTVFRAGFIGTGRFGTGLVVAKLGDGSWSAPSAIMTVGGGIGGVGASVTDVMLILNTRKAVETFSGGKGFQVGVGLALAVGPIGRSAEAEVNFGSDGGPAPVYAYSMSKGVFAGAMARLGIIMGRSGVNFRYYGHKVSTKELLSGVVTPPPNAEPLYAALRAAMQGTAPSLFDGGGAGPSSRQVYRSESLSDSKPAAETAGRRKKSLDPEEGGGVARARGNSAAAVYEDL